MRAWEDSMLASLGLRQLLKELQARQYRFTTMTPVSHELVNRRAGNALARDLAGIFGWNRWFEPHVMDDALFKLMQSLDLLENEGGSWRSRLRVSSLDAFLFLHSAFPTLDADAVFFGPDTYRFTRAIHHYLALQKPTVRRAVDIGCGSGAGAVLLAARLPQAEVWGTDINSKALALARVNGAASGCGNLHWQQGSLLDGLYGEFDLIVANPPYLVDREARAYRHGGGEFGAELSLAIVEAAIERLAVGGTLLLYTGVAILDGRDPFLHEVERMLQGSAMVFEYEEIDPDIFGEELALPQYQAADRIAAVLLALHKPLRL
ncbi:class I SAM-dependent methyltransferase [Methylobacillus sp.]|uniref:class I SAM-dependent methyltransferase n=1 Tax=Methylobacillus sp. TaxID=56818 RepID=UPI002FE3A749